MRKVKGCCFFILFFLVASVSFAGEWQMVLFPQDKAAIKYCRMAIAGFMSDIKKDKSDYFIGGDCQMMDTGVVALMLHPKGIWDAMGDYQSREYVVKEQLFPLWQKHYGAVIKSGKSYIPQICISRDGISCEPA